jgi:5-methylcytosine-specific restriction endonuclease McrA
VSNKEHNRAKLPVMPMNCVRRQNRKKAVTDGTKRVVYARDRNQCVVCGARRNLTVDHIYPRARGGCSHDHNLQLMCEKHNTQKGEKVPPAFAHYPDIRKVPKGPAQTPGLKDPDRVILVGAVLEMHVHARRGRTVL